MDRHDGEKSNARDERASSAANPVPRSGKFCRWCGGQHKWKDCPYKDDPDGGVARKNAEADRSAAITYAEATPREKLLADALAFYAEPETYFAIAFLPDPPCGDFIEDFEELEGNLGHPDGGKWVKPGKRAREALRACFIPREEAS